MPQNSSYFIHTYVNLAKLVNSLQKKNKEIYNISTKARKYKSTYIVCIRFITKNT